MKIVIRGTLCSAIHFFFLHNIFTASESDDRNVFSVTHTHTCHIRFVLLAEWMGNQMEKLHTSKREKHAAHASSMIMLKWPHVGIYNVCVLLLLHLFFFPFCVCWLVGCIPGKFDATIEHIEAALVHACQATLKRPPAIGRPNVDPFTLSDPPMP